METKENLEHPQQKDFTAQGLAENEQRNYTSVSSDDDEQSDEKSDLQNTDNEEEDISGDLAGNASGNENAEDE